MSTDENRSGPADHSAETGQGSVEPRPVEQTGEEPTRVEPRRVNETPAHEATLEQPAETGAPAQDPDERPGTSYPASPAPLPDETHVGQPTQQRDDPFAEVDGGESDRGAATTAFPTAEEDDAIRDERARRFGRPRSEGDAGSENQATSSGEEQTSRVPVAAAAGAGAGAVATRGAPGVADPAGTDSSSTRTMPATTSTSTTGEEDPFKDFDEGPASRAAAHWWSILISIVFAPVAWYLIADGGERMNFNLTNGGEFNWAGPLELAGGLLCLFFVLLAARWSSVGVILVGTITAAVGIAFIVFNTEAMDLVTEYQGTLVQALEQLGQNIVDHLLADARSGRLAVYGVALIMVGVVSHGARRQGRREERRKAAIGA
ncbi:hypothetical protein [Pseudactinotalea suaedae]|uniref:hypothetical protein n=1 Tax=Pseudactinotalea suaedae TaxID=1524924 RepID=UPI0012E30473|nr:hypothetical protein [Pseudactinotalea suaedae]